VPGTNTLSEESKAHSVSMCLLFVRHQGDLAWEMFFLLKGSVEIVVNAGLPEEEVCATMEAGSYFGELALLMGGHRSTSARVTDHCNLFVLYKVSHAASLFFKLSVHLDWLYLLYEHPMVPVICCV
jgi:CRP-like cAMP-binding protein